MPKVGQADKGKISAAAPLTKLPPTIKIAHKTVNPQFALAIKEVFGMTNKDCPELSSELNAIAARMSEHDEKTLLRILQEFAK